MGEIIVNAPSGQFTGTTVADDVTVFKRIVYGIAPRFSVAHPPQHEDLHMHKCGEDGKEMCELVLSITAPASAKPLDDLPVVVFIHGGSYEAGSYDEPWFNAVPFARDGVITVSVNYRLGFLGFTRFADEEPNRYRGIDDCEMALEWVQKNIESFGGNPTNVTLVGQSAGAGIVLWLCRRDHYKGAFRRAWAMSPAFPRQPFRSRLAKILLRTRLTRDALGKVDYDRLEKTQARMRSLVLNDLRFGPHPFRAQELSADIPLVVTSSQEEMLLSTAGQKRDASWWGRVLRPFYRRLFGANTLWLPPHRVRELGYLIGDAMIRKFVVQVADANPKKTWVLEYRGTTQDPIYHCADIPWFFGNFDSIPQDIPEIRHCPPLEKLVHEKALRFIHGEEPDWPEYGVDKQVLVAHLDGSTDIITDPLGYIREGMK